MTKSDKIKAQIEAMLAKAERTDNEHERDAYTAKAQQLMVKFAIDEADLISRGEATREAIVTESKFYSGDFARAMVTFAHQISIGFGDVSMFFTGNGKKCTVHVVGHESDVQNFWLLMNSLELQVHTARKVWWKNAPESAWMRNWDRFQAHRNFVLSFANECRRRLAATRSEAVADATPGAALVLADKAALVQDHIDQKHGKMRSSRGLGTTSTGWGAGRDAGRNASLGEKGIGGTKGALR
jgi:hypothetical protein